MKNSWLLLLASGSILHSATLTWDPLPVSSGVVGYDVHYGPVDSNPTSHMSLGQVTSTVINASGKNYFQVTGRDGSGVKSGPSNQVVWTTAVTPTPTPPPPQVSFSLAWNAVPNATKYRVFEGSIQIAEQTGLTYSLAGKVGPKSYTVRGVNSANVQGAASNAVSLAAPTPTPTPTPTPVPTPAAPVLQLIAPPQSDE
jgi:hypothetical protein